MGKIVKPEQLVPSQTSNSGKFLTTDGTTSSWAAVNTGPTVDVSTLATGGAGTLASPYTGWDAAFAALVEDGTSFLFNGFFAAAQNIDLSNRTSVTLYGLDGHMGQQPYNVPAINNWTCGILFNYSGSAPNIKAWNAAGITIRGMLLRNSNINFTGSLVDNSGGSGSNVSIGMTIEDCVLDCAGGTGSGQPDSCLKLDNAIEGRFTGVCFYGAKYNVRGCQQYPYSTAHSFRLCRFHSSTQSPIINPHMQWNFRDCVFEPAASGRGCWVKTDGGMASASNASIDSLCFDGCYQWDNAAGGNVIELNCAARGLTLRGCRTNTVGGVHIAVNAGFTLDGLTLIGNSFDNNSNVAGNGTLLKPSSFGTIHRATISGNVYGTGVDNLADAVNSGQVADGLVVDSNGDLLLPAVSGGVALGDSPTWTGQHVWAPTASGAVAVKFRASTASPGNIANFESSGGTALLSVTAAGNIVSSGHAFDISALDSSINFLAAAGYGFTFIGNPIVIYANYSGSHGLNIDTYSFGAPAATNLRLTLNPSQSADAFRVTNFDGTVDYATISENGYYTTRKNTAPANGELVAGELAWWFDSTNGAAKAMFKGKSANGTVVTGSVALT